MDYYSVHKVPALVEELPLEVLSRMKVSHLEIRSKLLDPKNQSQKTDFHPLGSRLKMEVDIFTPSTGFPLPNLF